MSKLTLPCVVIIGMGLSGCVGKPASDTSCVAFQIIRPSHSDTLDTKRQVLAHNTVYRKLCGGKK